MKIETQLHKIVKSGKVNYYLKHVDVTKLKFNDTWMKRTDITVSAVYAWQEF